MPEIFVRALDPAADWQAFRDMRLKAVAQYPAYFSADPEADETLWKTRWLGQGRENVSAFGGYVDGVHSGIVVVIPHPADLSNQTGYMVSLYVEQAARGTGLADAFYKACIEYARGVPKWQRLKVDHHATNNAAIVVSKRHGFTLVSVLASNTQTPIQCYALTLR